MGIEIEKVSRNYSALLWAPSHDSELGNCSKIEMNETDQWEFST